jgi:hypothetical protein
MKRQLVFLFAVLCGAGQAQQPIGSVAVQDATLTGNLDVNNGRAILVANTTVTAKDHTADVSLNRGGSVHVCATSGLHITAGKSAYGPAPLLLSLDRGAIEVRMSATTSDVVMTPDLRFSLRSDGPLDLRLRVVSNGDTCVENYGGNAPVLTAADQFGESSYDLRPGQHVLFEHGNLKEVVDNESSPCGCPPAPGVSIAEALISAPAKLGGAAEKPAEAQHPFPAAISSGLAPTAKVPQAPTGVVHAQVATTLSYDATGDSGSAAAAGSDAQQATAPAAPSASQATTPATQTSDATVAQTSAPLATQPSGDVAHWIGHFFKRLFGRH